MIFRQCYFISWLGDFREERLALLYEAVEWAKSHNFTIFIIAMGWRKEDFARFSGVRFIQLPIRTPPGHARNIALNIFYATNDDLCIILDDDTYIAEGDSVIELLRTTPVDGILYTVRDSKDPVIEAEGHRFQPPSQITSGVFIFRQEAQIFFNTEFKYYNGNLLWGEDVNLLGRVYDRGERAYEIVTSRTNITREREITPSTWYNNENFLQTDKHEEINSKDFTNRVKYENGIMICLDPASTPFEINTHT